MISGGWEEIDYKSTVAMSSARVRPRDVDSASERQTMCQMDVKSSCNCL